MAQFTKSRGRKPIAEGALSLSYSGSGAFAFGLFDVEAGRLFTLHLTVSEAEKLRDWLNKPREY